MFLLIPLLRVVNVAALAVPQIDTSAFNSTCSPVLNPAVATNQRSTWDILWSCLATIFACTWVSVHPNMPSPKDGKIRIALQRLELMVWGVMTPEMLIFWAMRQWRNARMLAARYREYGWTITHGHFLQMGGFILVEDGIDSSVLTPKEFNILLADKEIGFPLISEKEILDRSKGDGLSKALAVAQTSWFIAQCISRKVQHLTITEIELVTVAFAFLNGIMYFLWWNKPVDVTTCVRIYRLTSAIPQPKPIEIDRDQDPAFKYSLPNLQFMTIRLSEHTHITRYSLAKSEVGYIKSQSSLVTPPRQTTLPSSAPGVTLPVDRTYKPINPGLSVLIERWTSSKDLRRAFSFIFHRLDEMRGGPNHSGSGEATRVPTFFPPGDQAREPLGHFSVPAISTLFGLIHCLGWSLDFPSFAERFVWRVSAVIISAVPILVLCSHFIYFILQPIRKQVRRGYLATEYQQARMKLVVSIPIYLLARVGLLVEAFFSLRSLPSGAYSVVVWTGYLPHI
ncbi:hypothetical protein GALMADRAFT_103228 [Galerina marginata CBS 339.88]|uniref:Wax synthase domain-containing protein n=1 Tax=Galerina marginata (strain CBS 339.88) TaxID=685588 RepID=A0A067SHV7_GALM3|nr:hypothetical protein GALMADRAFT_103228 [Galerina marginata CBS 339.88]